MKLEYIYESERNDRDFPKEDFIIFLKKIMKNDRNNEIAQRILDSINQYDTVFINLDRNRQKDVPDIWLQIEGTETATGIPISRYNREIWEFLLKNCK